MKRLKLAGLLIVLLSLTWLPSCDPVDSIPCGSFDCLNGGECITDVNNISRCDCPDGFSGEDCGTDINDLSCDELDCENGAECVIDANGNASCECEEGTFGDFCEKVEDCSFIDECPPNSTCVVTDPDEGALCQCDQGYSPNTTTNTCDPIETPADCSEVPPCPPNSTCVEDDGDPGCACDDGFEPNADATQCVPIAANTRAKFLGAYDGVDNCREEPEPIPYNITVTASNSDPTKIFFAGLGGFQAPGGSDITLSATIINDTQFSIPEQTITFIDNTTGTFRGTTIGTYSILQFTQEEVLSISYEVLFSDPNTLDDECEAVWTKR